MSYTLQANLNGLAFILGENFIDDDRVALILGDNIFYGQGFSSSLQKARSRMSGSNVLGYAVKDPSHYGVVEFDVAT